MTEASDSEPFVLEDAGDGLSVEVEGDGVEWSEAEEDVDGGEALRALEAARPAAAFPAPVPVGRKWGSSAGACVFSVLLHGAALAAGYGLIAPALREEGTTGEFRFGVEGATESESPDVADVFAEDAAASRAALAANPAAGTAVEPDLLSDLPLPALPPLPLPDVKPMPPTIGNEPRQPWAAIGVEAVVEASGLKLPPRLPPISSGASGPSSGQTDASASNGAAGKTSNAGAPLPAGGSKQGATADAKGVETSGEARLTPPRVLRGGGRRGVRNGFDDRGLAIPEYPAESRRRGEQGVVELEVEVNADGTVGAVKVIADPGFPRLVGAAVAAVRATRFEAGTREGRAVGARLVVPFRFSLD